MILYNTFFSKILANANKTEKDQRLNNIKFKDFYIKHGIQRKTI